MTDAPVHPGGRPTKFTEAHVEQAYKLALLGATDKQMADVWDVTETTVNNWKNAHPEFLVSLKAGKTTADVTVAESLLNRAKGYSHPAVKIFLHEGKPVEVPYTEHYPPDPTSMIFWLKNRQPTLWRDKAELALGGTEELLAALSAASERARNAG